MVGWAKIKIPANPGREITVRFAEMLEKDGSLYTKNYRSARSTDTYICKGYGVEEWSPLFTYHGFRYVELSGFPENAKPSPDWVKGIVLHNAMPQIGTFVCSSPKVNALQSCIQWGQRGNFFSTPTDCRSATSASAGRATRRYSSRPRRSTWACVPSSRSGRATCATRRLRQAPKRAPLRTWRLTFSAKTLPTAPRGGLRQSSARGKSTCNTATKTFSKKIIRRCRSS